jgi:Flp pilus assembly protein TadG
MSSPAASTAYAKDMLRRFGRNRRGSAAVEFALVAPVFFALLFAVIETAIMLFASQVLESAAQDAARQILTGQSQAAGYTSAQFTTNVICNTSQPLFNCNTIGVDVESDPSQFSNLVITNPVTNGSYDPTKLQFNPGASCSVVTVTLFYPWQLFVTGLGYNISNLSGGKRLLSATAAFRNEPYSGACAS